jgi:uroporphyrinogen decarboxylase
MAPMEGLLRSPEPDWQGLVDDILRKDTPKRVYFIELFHDREVRDAIADRFDLMKGISPGDPDYDRRKNIAVNRFCRLDYARVGLVGQDWLLYKQSAGDTAALARAGGRKFQDEHRGPVMNWEDFERYPWPDPCAPEATRELEWYQEHLPEGMCIVGSGGFAHFAEYLTWLMGYETLCYCLHDERDLVAAISQALIDYFRVALERILQFDRVKVIWGSDDMGFKTGLLFSPDDMREFVLPGHRLMAEMSHDAGRPYLLHSCGNLTEIMDDLIDDVNIDGKHSFEDTIEDVRDAKRRHGRKIALLGGIDVDFLCRADEESVRRRVRGTLDVCMPGGGYCLGTGNSVANYIPLDKYLAMVDEGVLYGR